jgi:hypothetical protein
MRKQRSPFHPPVLQCKRRGTAQVELTLFLPTYAAAIMILLTIFSYARTRGDVAVETRHAAWLKRDLFGDATQSLNAATGTADYVGQILNGERDATRGLVQASKSDHASIFLKSLDLVTRIQLDHAVLTDPWDHRVLTFEPKADHPRLTLGSRTVVFGGFDRGAMQQLAAAAGTGALQAAQLNNDLSNQREQARRRIDRARATVTRMIDRLEQEIEAREDELSQLKRELARAQLQQPRDEEAVAALLDQIDECQDAIRSMTGEIDKLNQQLQTLNDARTFVS